MKRLFILIAIIACFGVSAIAQHSLKGKVIDTAGYPISFTTVSLLHKADSTLAFFSITNSEGVFDIKNVEKGVYLMQVAFMGFKTYYKALDIPYKDGDFGAVVLLSVAKQLDEVEITGDRIPIMIKNDTVEYNAGAFKTKPDANVQELLKKMPGIQVDRSGNIKAQGEGVSKVLVDGKEFFGNDPKVATQTLPADAINKVQVFNKKSEAAEFTGIDDGSREKTINLMLKDGKKAGYFGDVLTGVGTDERYKLSGKLYRFKPTSQIAAIGMLNNINEPGFSFQDYMNFNGGLRNFMSGDGSASFEFDESAPVNFGRQSTGLINSGAGGLNYSYEPRKNNRIAVSYLGNRSDKQLTQQTRTQNFTDNETFVRNDSTNSSSRNFAHRLNLNIRKDIDSVNQFTLAGNGTIADSRSNSRLLSASLVREAVLNRLDSRTDDMGESVKGNANASYLRNTKGKWPIFKAGANVTYESTLDRTEWNNITSILPATVINDVQFQEDDVMKTTASANTSAMRSLGGGKYIEPTVRAGTNTHSIHRQQGVPTADIFDSLSPEYSRQYQWVRPGLSYLNSANKKQLNATLNAEMAMLSTELNAKSLRNDDYFFLLPSLNWQYEYSTGKRLELGYNSYVNTPTAGQMLPVVNNANPVQRYIGNNSLSPEYQHRMHVNWIKFDQFNMSSLFASASAAYTADKISWARTINSDLTQSITPVNVAYGLNMNGQVDYGMPIRKLNVNINVSLGENYQQGINKVNDINNLTNTFTHELKLTVDNRKKEKIDIQAGGSVSLSNATYSVYKSLNNTFYNFTGFAEINYNPTDRWNFNAAADITQYNARSFDNAVIVPIVKAEASFYFLKGKRGMFSLYGFDLLNQNKGIDRISELNYLRETRSNIIGRYVMLSFKYKIGKTGSGMLDNVNISVK